MQTYKRSPGAHGCGCNQARTASEMNRSLNVLIADVIQMRVFLKLKILAFCCSTFGTICHVIFKISRL